MTAQAPPTIEILDAMMAVIPVILIVIALYLAFAVRIASRRRTGDGRASAGDPYFFAFGEMPTVDSRFVEFQRDQLEKICAAFSPTRELRACDARAWNIPEIEEKLFAGDALQRNESGGCQSPRSSAAALTSSEGAQHG